MTSNQTETQIKANHISTDDLAFSAYLRMKGHRLIRSNPQKSKAIFTFDVAACDGEQLKLEFINSEFLSYYNEIRNLKKLI